MAHLMKQALKYYSGPALGCPSDRPLAVEAVDATLRWSLSGSQQGSTTHASVDPTIRQSGAPRTCAKCVAVRLQVFSQNSVGKQISG
eukprot:8436769-Alexandrium_andersonii.AAC.1